MAWSLFELLSGCAEFTLQHTDEVEAAINQEFEESAATRLVNGVRMCRLQKAVLAVGMFSMFEAALQSHFGMDKPFHELDAFLRKKELGEVADAIKDYKDAINALKHGTGKSHDALLKRVDDLEFRVKEPETFFEEGDVSEIDILVDVDAHFVRRCAEMIQTATRAVEEDLNAQMPAAVMDGPAVA